MDDLTGHLAVSLAGRDKGTVCVIVGNADEEGYVLIADGRTRKVESPKKKKLKHIRLVDSIPVEQRRISELKLTNRFIREFIGAVTTEPDKTV